MHRPFVLILGLSVILSASPSSAQSPTILDTANTAALVAHSADLASTARCIGAGTCAEANIFLRPYVEHPPRFFAIKMGSAFASWFVKNHTKQRHPKLTLLLAIGETVAFSAIAYHNHKVSSR